MNDSFTPEKKASILQLADLAMESEMADPIDWGMLKISERDAFIMMASNVIEQLESVKEEERPVVAMATITKLLVENFVLNLRLKGAENVKHQV
jgi:hypothetical protein